MHIDQFDYSLPSDLIAQAPKPFRSHSRLLYVDRRQRRLQDRYFYELPNFLQPGDLLVLNDTQVIPARIYGRKSSGGRVEIMLERQLDTNRILAQIRASKALKPDSRVVIDQETFFTVEQRHDGLYTLVCNRDPMAVLRLHGHVPLPPYIDRPTESWDQERYQTIYAKTLGAVAAPTAGLQFIVDHLEHLPHLAEPEVTIKAPAMP